MSFRKALTLAFIILSLCVATLIDHPAEMNIDVQSGNLNSKSHSVLVIFLAPLTAEARDLAEKTILSLKEHIRFSEVFLESRPIQQSLRQTLKIGTTPVSVFMKALIFLALEIDRAFTGHSSLRALLAGLEASGFSTLVIDSSSRLSPEIQNKIFPDQSFSASYKNVESHEDRVIQLSSASDFLDFILDGTIKSPFIHETVTTLFSRINLEDYPGLSPPLCLPPNRNKNSGPEKNFETIGFVSMNNSSMAFVYPTMEGMKWAYCTSENAVKACSHDLATFSRDDQSRLVSQRRETDIFRKLMSNKTIVLEQELDFLRNLRIGNPKISPQVDFASIGMAAIYELLERCDNDTLLPKQAALLHDIVLKRRGYIDGVDSTLPKALSSCAKKIQDSKLVRYAEFQNARAKRENADFVSEEVFFKELTGVPSKNKFSTESTNWFSDAILFFSPVRQSWLMIAGQNLPGRAIRSAPSQKAIDALTMILIMQNRHFNNRIFREFKSKLIERSGYLDSVELAWVEKQLAAFTKSKVV